MKTKVKSVFHEGAIAPSFIAECIAAQQHHTEIGAHDIFLGQVRADQIKSKTVAAIEYTAYESMALQKFTEIAEKTREKFEITDLQIYHSLGKVPVGEICLFVFVCAPHRRVTFEALEFAVEAIKAEVPVFGKELFEDDSYQWK
ncbi:MAG: molybdenum cofactor biosynthesis protein MoaE, partial [Bacteroidota bacterium]